MLGTRIYLIGAGHVARTHAAAIRKLSGSDFQLSVTDVNADMRSSFADEFPEARVYGDVAGMLEDPPSPEDIVVVATPPVTHFELAAQALRTGRHVLCEKPLTMSNEQAERLLELARSQGRMLGCCSDRFLGAPTTEEVKRLVASDELGRLYHVRFVHRLQRNRPGVEHQPSSSWFLDRGQSGGGVLMDWGPYDISILNDVLSPVRVDVLSAWTANPETVLRLPSKAVFDVETHVAASLRYHLASGEVVNVSYERSSCTHGSEGSIAEIEGTKGAVTWDWLSSAESSIVSRSYDQEGKVVHSEKAVDATSEISFMDRPLVYFYRKMLGESSVAIVDEQAVFNFSCLQAIYACAESGTTQTASLELRR